MINAIVTDRHSDPDASKVIEVLHNHNNNETYNDNQVSNRKELHRSFGAYHVRFGAT